MFGGIAGRPFSAGISEVAQRVDEGPPRRGQGSHHSQHGGDGSSHQHLRHAEPQHQSDGASAHQHQQAFTPQEGAELSRPRTQLGEDGKRALASLCVAITVAPPA